MQEVLTTLPELSVTVAVALIFAMATYLIVRMFVEYLKTRDSTFHQVQLERDAAHEAVIQKITEKANAEWGRWRQDISAALLDNSRAIVKLTESNHEIERTRMKEHQELKDALADMRYNIGGNHHGHN